MNHAIETAPAANIPLAERASQLLQKEAVHYVLLAGVTLLAILMRMFKLGEWSFWIDEAYNVNYATNLWENFRLLEQPSLILSSFALKWLGINDWTARIVPAVIGILSIPILYIPTRKVFGAHVALLSSFLLALSPWHLYWSQNARFYTALLLFYTLALFAFYFWLEQDRFWLLVASGLLLGLAVLERMMAAFFVPVVGAYILALLLIPSFKRPAGLRWRNLLLLGLPPLAFGVFQLAVMGFGGGEPFYAEFVRTFIGKQHNPLRILFSVVYDVGLPLFLMAVIGSMYLLWQRSRAGLFMTLSAFLPLALVLLAAPFTQTFSRYIFHVLPAFTILGAFAITELFRQVSQPGRFLALGVLLLLLVDPLSQNLLYYGYQNGNREDWKGAYQFVEARMQPGDVISTTRVEIAEYYLGVEPLWTQNLHPRDVVASGQRTWFVIDNRTAFVSSRLQTWLDEETRQVGVYDVYIPGKTMMMRVYLYEPPE
jgi:mannosyltransferase